MTYDQINNLDVTNHAREALKSRRVLWGAIVEALHRPDVVEPHGDARRYVRDGLAFVVAEAASTAPVLVTVLLRRREQWTNRDARSRAAHA